MKSHLLSKGFDVSITMRESALKKNNLTNKQACIDTAMVNHLIKHKEQIDYIQVITEGRNNVYLNGELCALNDDELVQVIRQSPHLYYNKGKNLFINLKLIRTIEQTNSEKLVFSIDKGFGIELINTGFSNFEQFFDIVESLNVDTIYRSDFAKLNLNKFLTKTTKLIRLNLFTENERGLFKNSRYSLLSICSCFLLYLIPLIPVVGFNEYSVWIYPITSVLIFSLLFKRMSIKNTLLKFY